MEALLKNPNIKIRDIETVKEKFRQIQKGGKNDLMVSLAKYFRGQARSCANLQRAGAYRRSQIESPYLDASHVHLRLECARGGRPI
ncbi:hypothetical protein L596_025923 [Steinernema carpocapsae]|uniref:Uncharacterized protein n=1 Tax=Steinernema carpocapsae TaxID=34508 RepID=A0A4U5M9G8_STECR|nr:hypothetical protein L596_025923 [Steinernema carpocapsae]